MTQGSRRIVWLIFVSFCLVSIQCQHFDDSLVDFDDWFSRLNDDLRSIYQYSAEISWQMNVNSVSAEAATAARKFDAFKTKWINEKCREAKLLLASSINASQNELNQSAMAFTIEKLCSGPKFTEYQIDGLNNRFNRMQKLFADTKVCLPVRFDVCLNLDRLWDFTYVRDSANNFHLLNLSEFVPKKLRKLPSSQLHLYNTKLNFDFHVTEPKLIEKIIRSGPMKCLDGENDLERISGGDFSAFNRSDCVLRLDEVFRWSWESWRAAVGPEIGESYAYAVALMNTGARNNGYRDMAEVWQSEIELDNPELEMGKLLKQAQPFYKLLHGILRRALWKRFSQSESFEVDGTIPAHLLGLHLTFLGLLFRRVDVFNVFIGSMWSQNWRLYHNLLMPNIDFDLDEQIRKTHWTAIDMVKRADDFYRSLRMSAMPKSFWEKSIFKKIDKSQKCHGSAVNMFANDDVRLR